MIQFIREVKTHRHALWGQFYVNIKTTVATTWLGPLWWILDPLFLMLIYYFVVKIVFGRGGPNYHLFALCGIVTWQAFSRALTLTSSSLTRNRSLIRQVSIPMTIYMLISPLVQGFFYTIGLVIIMLWNYSAIGLHTLMLVLIIGLIILLPFAIGIFFATAQVFINDVEKFVQYVLRFGFYLSPILYSPERVYKNPHIPHIAKLVFSLNPMVPIITSVRDLLLYGQPCNLKSVILLYLEAAIILQIGLWFFRWVAPYIPKQL